MNQQRRRLTLHKQTLRNLTADRLVRVAGGFPSAYTCNSSCWQICPTDECSYGPECTTGCGGGPRTTTYPR